MDGADGLNPGGSLSPLSSHSLMTEYRYVKVID